MADAAVLDWVAKVGESFVTGEFFISSLSHQAHRMRRSLKVQVNWQIGLK